MHKALHPRDEVDRLYMTMREGGKWLASIEDSVDTSMQRLEGCIQKLPPETIQTKRGSEERQ